MLEHRIVLFWPESEAFDADHEEGTQREHMHIKGRDSFQGRAAQALGLLPDGL